MESVFYKVDFTTFHEEQHKERRIIEVPHGTAPEDIKPFIMEKVREELYYKPGENTRTVEMYDGRILNQRLCDVDWKLAPLTKWAVDTNVIGDYPQVDCRFTVLAADKRHAEEIVHKQVQAEGAEAFFEYACMEFDRIETEAEKAKPDAELGQEY
tara:strand:- start:4 stop:468 length:465 start_codon:yes stop_codon:yes gene_type:complete